MNTITLNTMGEYTRFLITLLVLITLITAGCSDVNESSDDKDPYQKIINDGTPRFIFGDINEKVNGTFYINYMYNDVWIGINLDDDKRATLMYEGQNIEAGVKNGTLVSIFYDFGQMETYMYEEITEFVVLKVVEPEGQKPGKIWIVAEAGGKKLIYVNDYYEGSRLS